MPVLLGGGIRIFDGFGAHVELEPVEVITTPAAIHQRFRVLAP